MKKVWLFCSVAGFVLPNIFVAKVSMETGNWLLWRNPIVSIQQMFANDIAATFSTDLIVVVLIFFLWSYLEAQRHNIQRLWLIWLLTAMFGLAFSFPLFLYLWESKIPSSQKD
ncbi:MAG: DUF2834 domain-containing protein [Bacteroidota bacterium]